MSFRKKIYVGAGYKTLFFGYGRKEFDPTKPMPSFESYLQETAKGTLEQIPTVSFDEGILGTFMSQRFLNQGNIPAFLPFMVPDLTKKPCTAVEGACGTGGRAIATGLKTILSDLGESVFVASFEVQNTMKAIYGADILAGASYYSRERKKGQAYFFPGIFSERAGAYYQKYGYETTRKALAKWYENAILNARRDPKAQEAHNVTPDLFSLGMTPPDPKKFLPYLNAFDCSKVSDGASSLSLFSEEGLARSGIEKNQVVEIIGMGAAAGDITQEPEDLLSLTQTEVAVQKALSQANISLSEIAVFEVHDCFTISGLLSLEAIGLTPKGKAPEFVLDGHIGIGGVTPTNVSGGLIGFGHPTGATGIRQMVDLWQQLTGKAANQLKLRTPYAMMVSMGGNDKTVTCFIVKKCD